MFVPLEELTLTVQKQLDQMQKDMFTKAKKFMTDNTSHVQDWAGFKKAIESRHMIYAPWCCTADCAELIKKETEGAKCLTLPFESPLPKGKCVKCDKPATNTALFAKSY